MIEFAGLGAFVLLLGAFLLWRERSILPAVIFSVLSITAAAGLFEMRSLPKPLNLEWRSSEQAEVLWYGFHEGESITVLLDLAGTARLYVMPWDGERARQLMQSGREAAETGSTLRMQRPFESSLETRERLFYADPQPAPPPKGG